MPILNHQTRSTLKNHDTESSKTIKIESSSSLFQKWSESFWKNLNFEFMDLTFMPNSLRNALRDILECGNSFPFRSYFKWTAKGTVDFAKNTNCKNIVELGAGTAPLSRLLFVQNRDNDLSFCPTDINPDLTLYRHLENRSKGVIKPKYSPVDFSKNMQWNKTDLLLLSATFHHIPQHQKSQVLNNLMNSGAGSIVISEPLNNNLASIIFAFFSLVPALLTPLVFISRPGALRRIIWCWFIPVAPLFFIWDGVISALRCWKIKDWKKQGSGDSKIKFFTIQESLFCTLLKWELNPPLSKVKKEYKQKDDLKKHQAISADSI